MLLAELNIVYTRSCSQHCRVPSGMTWQSPGKFFTSLGVYL